MLQVNEISSGCGEKEIDYLCITKTFHSVNKFNEVADKIGKIFSLRDFYHIFFSIDTDHSVNFFF